MVEVERGADQRQVGQRQGEPDQALMAGVAAMRTAGADLDSDDRESRPRQAITPASSG